MSVLSVTDTPQAVESTMHCAQNGGLEKVDTSKNRALVVVPTATPVLQQQ